MDAQGGAFLTQLQPTLTIRAVNLQRYHGIKGRGVPSAWSFSRSALMYPFERFEDN